MLRYLRVRNLAIIREIHLDLFPGLTVVTGETGAGKSILVDSLSFVLGERAGSERARFGETGASVEAVFDLSRRPDLLPILEARGWLNGGGELILRREVQPEGRGRAFIGPRVASLADLHTLGERLVDLHGQHDHQTLLRPEEHLPLLDRFGDNQSIRRKVGELYSEIRRVRSRLESLTRDQQEIARRVEILKFQIAEIDRAALRAGERETLLVERSRLRNRDRIRELSLSALEGLYEGEGAALSDLGRVLASVRELAHFDSSLESPLARAEEAVLALGDLAETLQRAAEEREHDPACLEEIENRLALLDLLARKYGPEEETVSRFRDRAAAELSDLTSAETSVEALEGRLRMLCDEFAREAMSLSSRRQRDALALEKAVRAELGDLAMERTDFVVELKVIEESGSPVLREGVPVTFDAAGWDKVRFLVRTNPGEPLRPLEKVASGGELSRIMLSIHGVLRDAHDGTVRVFDEVDAGIGGRAAEAVGGKLRSLATGGQVLCVTHLPQIASMADHHILVSKRVRSGRTEVKAETLDRGGAIREVARMLGGARISELTLRHASEMVNRGR